MEGNKKSNVAVIFLVIALIVIAVMGYFMYKLYNEKVIAEAKVEELSAVTTDLSQKTHQLQSTIDNISDTIANGNGTAKSNIKYTEITKELEEGSALYVTNVIKVGDNYKLQGVIYQLYPVSEAELKSALTSGTMEVYGNKYTIKGDENEGYFLYNDTSENSFYMISKNSNGSYILTDTQGQTNTRWKLTEDYREITISGDLKCNFPYGIDDDVNVKLASEVFNDFNEVSTKLDIGTGTSNLFYFTFTNGKCSELTCAHHSI